MTGLPFPATAAMFPATAPASNLGQILGGIFMAALVCALAYATTRFLAGRLGGQPPAAGRANRPGHPFSFGRQPRRANRLEIVERLGIGRDRQILIVRAGGQHFLAGVSAGSIHFGPPVTLASSEAAQDAVEPAGQHTRTGMAGPHGVHGGDCQFKAPAESSAFADILNAIK